MEKFIQLGDEMGVVLAPIPPPLQGDLRAIKSKWIERLREIRPWVWPSMGHPQETMQRGANDSATERSRIMDSNDSATESLPYHGFKRFSLRKNPVSWIQAIRPQKESCIMDSNDLDSERIPYHKFKRFGHRKTPVSWIQTIRHRKIPYHGLKRFGHRKIPVSWIQTIRPQNDSRIMDSSDSATERILYHGFKRFATERSRIMD